MKSDWKQIVRTRLCECGWSHISLRELFEEVAAFIPLHQAFRRAALEGDPDRGVRDAQLRIFKIYLYQLNVETETPGYDGRENFEYLTARIRLPLYQNGKYGCETCGGTIRKCASKFYCKKCEAFVKEPKRNLLVFPLGREAA